MGRRLMVVLAAVVVGLMGVVLVLFYANGADSRAVKDQLPQNVFIAQKLVPSGTTAAAAVAQGLMAPTPIAAKGVPVGALTKVDAATGKLLALTDITPGEFVVASRFGKTPLGQKALQVPGGQVAISVSLAESARVGTFVTPGSRIVIYHTYAPSSGAGTKQTRVLLDDVLVIAVGAVSLTPVPDAEGQTQAPVAGAPVTVALPPAQAAKLVHGIQTGTLYAGLRGTDAKANLGEIVSDTTLFKK